MYKMLFGKGDSTQLVWTLMLSFYLIVLTCSMDEVRDFMDGSVGACAAFNIIFLNFAGGREKAPAAFCRKVITSSDTFQMWGDGKQTRSFTFIDECVEGVLR